MTDIDPRVDLHSDVTQVPVSLDTLRRWVDLGLSLPPPACGDSLARWNGLRDASRACPSIGRLFEAHEDAAAILREAGRAPVAEALYAVWASRHRCRVEMRRRSDGSLVMQGVQNFAGGAAVADRALVEVDMDGSRRLVDVDLHAPGLRVVEGSWPSPAFPVAGIRTVDLDHVGVEETDLVAGPGWYGERVGFWHGSIGVAACWVGLVQSFVDEAEGTALSPARRGRVAAELWGMQSCLHTAAAWMDEHPERNAAIVALACRRQVAESGHRVIRDVLDGGGPAILAFNQTSARLYLEIQLALGQHHHDGDAELLGSTSDGCSTRPF